MDHQEITIHHEDSAKPSTPNEVTALLTERWGSSEIVSFGKKVNAGTLPRVVARDDEGKLVGLATYDIAGDTCELVTIDAVVQGKRIGSQLLDAVEQVARRKGCRRIKLITTNDNPEAAAFYLKRGYRLISVKLDALDQSRRLKPEIPAIGNHGIPLTDEWVFEKVISQTEDYLDRTAKRQSDAK